MGGAADTDVAEDDTDDSSWTECSGHFGIPGPMTGMDADSCQAECECLQGTWTAPQYDADLIEELRRWTLLNEQEIPAEDPYEDEEFDLPPRDGVCAVVIEDLSQRLYRLQTFETVDAAVEAQAHITHHEACGLCSSLSDLATYMEHTDLTEPVRACGMTGLTQGQTAQRDCIAALGFTPQCTAIWSWNTDNTRRQCLEICFDYHDEPYNMPDGSLNPCLQCDEDESGEIFQAVAGRTRRNSGLPSAICRPCDDLVLLTHDELDAP